MKPEESGNPILLIGTAVGSVIATVLVLWYYGYVHFARPEDALQLDQFTMLKTVPGVDYRLGIKPARQRARCVDGVLVLFDSEHQGLSGVLVDSRQRAVRCTGEEVSVRTKTE